LHREAEARRELGFARQRLAGIVNADTRLRAEADVLGVEAAVWRRVDPAGAAASAERLIGLPVLPPGDLRRARALVHLAELAMTRGDFAAAERHVNDGFAELELVRGSPSAALTLRASDPAWQLYSRATELALRRGDTAQAFAYAERGRVRTAQEEKVWGARVVTLDAVQRQLPRDSALLMLTQIGEALHIWVIRHDRVFAHEAAISRARAALLVATQHEEMVRGDKDPKTSAQLFDAVLRPVSSALADAGTVVVVADAPYDRIAFAGLWDSARDRYLVENHRLLVSPSATAFANAAAARPAAPKPNTQRAAFVSAPNVESALTRSETTAAALQAAYGAGRMSRNDAATASDLAHEVAGADVVHIAANVLQNDQFPDLSHVAMADNPGHRYSGKVFARDLADLERRNVQLIALERVPEGPIGTDADQSSALTRSLVAAGVPFVVSPVVAVEPQRIERTWLDFHRHYAAGAAVADSLRRAQLAALSQSDRRPGPWATLTVFGSAQ
jgi:hypothetical protein